MRRLFLLLALLIAMGCHKRTPLTALPPPPPLETVPPPAAEIPPSTLPAVAKLPNPAPATSTGMVVPSGLEQADSAFGNGRYAEAARGYEGYLQRQGADKRDEVLFHLALSYALAATPDWVRAGNIFKQLVDQFPKSPLRPPALVILSLQTQLSALNADSQKRDQRIKQLATELDKIRQIDADRRKKP